MKLIEKLTKKAVTQVSDTVKTEIKEKSVDIIPVVLVLVGAFIFSKSSPKPSVISIVNNYYIGGNLK